MESRKRKRSPSPSASSKSQKLQYVEEEKKCVACGATGHIETECNELFRMGQQLREGEHQAPQANFFSNPNSIPVLNDSILRQQVAMHMQSLQQEAEAQSSTSSTIECCWVCKKPNHTARNCTEQIKCLSCGEHTSACLHKGLDDTYQCDLCGARDHCFGQCDKFYQQARI